MHTFGLFNWILELQVMIRPKKKGGGGVVMKEYVKKDGARSRV